MQPSAVDDALKSVLNQQRNATQPVLPVAKALFFAAACVCLLSGPGCKQSAGSSEPTPATAGHLEASIKVGQSLPVGPFTVKLISVQEGRCARENCSLCYGGYAKVQLDVTAAGQPTQRLVFSRISCLITEDLPLTNTNVDLQRVQDYDIGLINLTELSTAAPVAADDYNAKFLLKKH